MLYLFVLLLGLISCLIKNEQRLVSVNNFVLGFSLITYILSEALSVGGWFSINILRFVSCGVGIYFLYHLWIEKEKVNRFFKQIFKTPTITQFYVLVLLCGIGASALLYAPNNWDSNTYHLPRMVIWLQNHNLYHYPTHIFRQIYQPILSEVQLTWIYSTYGSLSLLNLQQLFFLIFSINVGFLILRLLFLKGTILFTDVAIAVLSVSSAVLEASNTKNDLVITFFILNYVYCWVLFIKEGRLNIFIFISSVALSILTKGTSYIFLTSISAGFLLILLFNGKLIKKLAIGDNFKRLLAAIGIALVLLLPFYYRNISLSGNIFCQDEKEKVFYQSESVTVKSVVSNSLKNLSVQYCPPFYFFPVYEIVQKIHHTLNLSSVDDPALNFAGFKYSTPEMKIKNYFEEDTVPNFILFITSLFVFLIAFFEYKKSNFPLWLYGTFLFVLTFIVFSAMLKWQIWHTRLLIPAFILLSLSNLFVIKNSSFYRIWLHVTFFGSCFAVFFNNQRPVLPYGKISRTFKENVFNRSYYDVLPANKNKIYNYRQFNSRFEAGGLNIGFICRNDAGVFPYMWNNRKWKNKYYFVGKITNLSGNNFQTTPNLDYIVMDARLMGEPTNKLLVQGYQMIDATSYGIILFKNPAKPG